ncbi:small GTP-binding domain protein [Nitzschia inconspicua]|uniref:Small GTP-binding domain protein n=1 Tax=Nitzschia inconspicua TaxID=303405 RepID=A0A9K3K9P4_9STRA|nr:small GTP-binding domain protein [Nitzschia inconspicua]KAG7339605.1 small GTP-binding domain protein [Nitzschia inconspicua]KAG7365613.1 small GTP-binding domain protein [Nitzschia inconspicua]
MTVQSQQQQSQQQQQQQEEEKEELPVSTTSTTITNNNNIWTSINCNTNWQQYNNNTKASAATTTTNISSTRTITTITNTTKVRCIVLGGANAGKSSILRRYFYGKFDEARMPTRGADYYAKRMEYNNNTTNNSTTNDNTSTQQQQQQQMISIQVWDTPGRERVTSSSSSSTTKSSTTPTSTTTSFSDHFLQQIDVAMLVYDVSSSTSFTHVLKWHAELLERFKRMKRSQSQRSSIPMIIVGNKSDLMEERLEKKRELLLQKGQQLRHQYNDNNNNNVVQQQHSVVKQRNVLGVTNYRGKDYRYEYTTTNTTTAPAASTSSLSKLNPNNNNNNNQDLLLSSSNSSPSSPTHHRFELSTYMGTKTSNYLESILSHQVYRGSYLDSVLSSEDKSHPDQDMVVLWCVRNNLPHVTVSAKKGHGIDQLMQLVIQLAMTEKRQQIQQQQQQPYQNNNNNNNNNNTILQELDLHQRYAPKKRHYCCFLGITNYCK